ncbi:hypothetical protein CRG98_032909 [Punica granatum]|uniref:glucan endo-1,3-beta-D-glucosidase n=1 Tax=Punica granatum TaxID=22663 RepID=A0A2I0IRE5_PUNGR|nr:hypothetical protein CRG98_032909 [Punica granatum]
MTFAELMRFAKSNTRYSSTETPVSIPASAIGVNYGTLGDNLPPPAQVANFIKTQTIIDRVKIFDTNPDILRGFANSGIAMTITAANGDIPALTQIGYARQWVATNIAPFYPQTNIIRVLVGNEILHWGDESQVSNLVPAMRTLRDALNQAGYGAIQVSTAHSLGFIENADIPSMCRFRPMYERVLRPLLQFHRETKSPFMVNPYPYFGYSPEKANYCLFKPNRGVYDRGTRKMYTNMFDSLLDAVHIAMRVYGYGELGIVVGETGWASQGDAGLAPGMDNAIAYNGNLLRHVQSTGTPLMPNRRFETYIFALFNENQKPGPLAEKNFGLFWPNFSPVYKIGILRSEQAAQRQGPATPAPGLRPRHGGHHKRGAAPVPVAGKQWCVPKLGVSDQALQSNVNYICSQGINCQPVQAGGPCFEPNNLRSHASFLMNSYYQTKGLFPYNCDFAGTGMLTSTNPICPALRHV